MEKRPNEIATIKKRVASRIPVSHCLKCSWWIARVQETCDRCGEDLILWSNSDEEREDDGLIRTDDSATQSSTPREQEGDDNGGEG